MSLTYRDFAIDECKYFCVAYTTGLRFNGMITQMQRVCELFLKHLIDKSLVNNTKLMMSHNLRELYDYVLSLGIDLSGIREDIMFLNNFYMHTRYPGKDSYFATKEDIEAACKHLSSAVGVLSERTK